MREGFCKTGCGACCKFLVLQVNPQYYNSPDIKNWVELHGIRLVKRDGGVWAYIQATCRELQEDNSCGLYGKPERPNVCAEWPFNQAEINDLDAFVGEKTCSYSFTEVV